MNKMKPAKTKSVYMHLSNGGLSYSLVPLFYNVEKKEWVMALRQTTSNHSLFTNVDILLPSKKAVSALIKMLQELESNMPNKTLVYDLESPERYPE